MRIDYFAANGLHGYLNFKKVTFNSDLTFLTGINGSGKTSVVTAVAAMITPVLPTLARGHYRDMSVGITHDGRQSEIKCVCSDQLVHISISGVDECLDLPVLSDNFARHGSPTPDEDEEYYHALEVRNAQHPVILALQRLPTPMVLGIERRSNDFFPPEDYISAYVARRRQRNVFSSSIHRSLLEAVDIAEQKCRAIQAIQRRLTDRLRKDIILSAIEYKPASIDDLVQGIVKPEANLGNTESIKATLRELGLSSEEVDRNLDPFIERLTEITQSLTWNRRTPVDRRDQDALNVHLDWLINRPQFERLRRIIGDVERYTESAQRTNQPIQSYLDTVNMFLRDSGKALFFNNTGNLMVMINDVGQRPVTALSSGESQLVVILTHLAFNPAADRANVFIVDEPELSLHLRWQELFVDSVRKVNPKLQVILATHSPSIILRRVGNCVDLGMRH